MEKNGEFQEEKETQPQKEVQKEVYKPIEKNGMDQPKGKAKYQVLFDENF